MKIKKRLVWLNEDFARDLKIIAAKKGKPMLRLNMRDDDIFNERVRPKKNKNVFDFKI